MKRERYINPFTDFGFRRLSGEEPNKDLLPDFLNGLLRKEKGNIREITYLRSEHLPHIHAERGNKIKNSLNYLYVTDRIFSNVPSFFISSIALEKFSASSFPFSVN